MKKALLLIILIIGSTTPGFSQDWALRAGVHFTPGLIYNGNWDPGYNGSALTASARYLVQGFILEAGAEVGYDYSGLNLLLALGAGVRLLDFKPISLDALVTVLPGIKLNRPLPYFLLAFEAACRFGFEIAPGTSLGASIGPRFSFSPDYAAEVGPYQFLDLTTELSLTFLL